MLFYFVVIKRFIVTFKKLEENLFIEEYIFNKYI